jgi:hypothetical protein
MSCALIIAFSHGCIIQSFLARTYMLFVLLISVCFYCYLLWRIKHKRSALIAYTFLGCLAVATHFSGLFAIICIAFCEGRVMHKKSTSQHDWLMWICANGLILLVGVGLYYLWLPMLTILKPYFSISPLSYDTYMYLLLLYPLSVSLYLFPSINASTALTCGFVAIAVRPGNIAKQSVDFRFLLTLIGFAFALGIILFATNIYCPMGGRHKLWMLPFIIPVLGWLLADMCNLLANRLTGFIQFPWLAIIAVMMLIGGYALYSPTDRFSDESEYALTTTQQAAVEQFFDKLGASDMIFIERDDAMMFQNIYPALGSAPYTGRVHAMQGPYHATHMIFDPFYRRIYSEGILTNMFKEALEKHLLDGIDRLVFFYSLWPRSVAKTLMQCDALDKQVIVYTDTGPSYNASKQDIEHAHAAVMIIAKELFIKDLLSPTGKAHACLSAAHQ